ncbi:MAG: hypothetical protein ABIT10_03250 [Alteraurantiacibacter sp.]
MASIAHDSGQSQSRGRNASSSAGKHPISTHPAFPFIVALWFAALLGIGSLVVPVQTIEQLVEVTGLAALVPQTAPPLGFTARALIALVATVGGGIAGLLIARKVAEAHRAPPAPRFAHTVAAARRPIAAHDELGADGFDGTAPRGRRALAIAEEEGPSEVFDLAPLPGRRLPLSALDLHEAEALELADEQVFAPPPLVEPGFTSLTDAPAPRDFVMHERQQFTFPASEGRQQFFVSTDAEVSDAGVPEPVAADEPEFMPEPAPVADLAFSPPSLARAFAAPVEEVAEEPAAAELEVEPEAEPDMPMAAPEPVPEPAQWQDGELEDLALVQLAQRLGSSIARRREARAAQEAAAAAAAVVQSVPASVPLPAKLAEDFDAAEAAEAAKAMAAYFGASAAAPVEPASAEPLRAVEQAPVPAPEPAPAPAAEEPVGSRQTFQPAPQVASVAPVNPLAGLARIDLGEEDDDDDDGIAHLTASFSLPLARPAMAQIPAQPEAKADEAVTASLANPFQQRANMFVRIENEPQPEDGAVEPAVVFPGESPFAKPFAKSFEHPAAGASAAVAPPPRVNTDENERALREALLNLQRMSSVG